MDINQMEGWLLKKKSKSGMFNNDVRRWFKIQRLEGTEDELALCYFSSNKSKDVKGWIFLSDIIELSEDKSSLTVVSPARTLTVGTQTIGEHRLWITALVKLCPTALYTGETVSKVRNGDYAEEKSSSHDYDRDYDSKAEDGRDKDRRTRRSTSRDSLDRNRDLRDDREHNMGARGGGKESLSLRTSSSREDLCPGSDEDRHNRDRGGHERGHRKYRSGDDNSTGSSGSRGRGSRMPNTNDDHRKGGNLSYPDASTAARMHSHISGEPDDRVHRGRPPPQQPSRGARSRSRENDEYHRGEDPRDSYELEAYDMSKASTLLSREERMRLSKEDEMRNQGDNGSSINEEKDACQERVPAIVKRKKPAPPAGGPQPRWRSPSREGSSDEEKSPDRDHRDSDGVDSDSTPIQKPVKKRGVSIEEMINEPMLSVNLDDSDDEEKVDFEGEKRRYAGDAKAQSEREKIENAKSRPPLAPPKAATARQGSDHQSPRSHKGGDSSRTGSGSAGVDSNFVSDDWDDDMDSPPKAMGKPSVHTGSQADSNWLDEDFDD